MDSLIHWLPADDNYSLNNSEKLPQPTEMDLSQNSKVLLNFLLHIWDLCQILNFLQEVETNSLRISELIESKRRGYLYV